MITYALIQMLEKVAEHTNNTKAKIICKARVYKLIQNSAGACVGCEYELGGKVMQEHGPVILASGGFGADFTATGLLAKYRPDLLHLPTTNGEHCTGDGIKMGEEIGAATIDLEWVQVHPTGLVKPDDADAKVKFLAAEALRGVGGILIDSKGERFANELGRRDYVTGRMWKNKPPFRLMLNSKAAKEIHWHCEHYKGRGVMKYYENCEELAKEAGFKYETLAKTMATYNGIAAKMMAGEPGAPYEAYGGGMSWDPWGKKFFHNVPVEPTDEFHVAIVTPVIHYCMGGLEIDADSRVVKKVGGQMVAIDGLYAAGEIAGGVHGNNRLGGNSLLDCVVFGRVAGKHAAKYILGECVPTFLEELSGAYSKGGATAGAQSAGGEEAAGASAAPAAQFSLDEVATHNNKSDCWVVLHDRVLDVTDFLKDHPGGELAIITFAGKDATAEFDMIHPPDVLEKYLDPSATKGVVAGSAAAAAAAAGGGAAGGGGAPGKVGKGKDDAKIWGKYPHETHATSAPLIITVVTALYLMVMSFLKEICFTIFSAPLFTVKFDSTRNYLGLVWFLALLYSVEQMNLLYGGALLLLAVVIAAVQVSLKRAGLFCYSVRNDSLTQKLLDP